MRWTNKGFFANDWVEVRSREEILQTLDASGELDSLPFMPEMLRHCGKRYRILKSAHKTCDTVNRTGGRRMKDCVHLDTLRCDGRFHGNCQARCLYFWKTAWLRPVSVPADQTPAEQQEPIDVEAPYTGAEKLRTIDEAETASANQPVFTCQATRLYDATTPLKHTRLSQYVADIHSRNFRPWAAFKILLLAGLYNLRHIGVGYNLSIRLYDAAHKLLRGTPAPRWRGVIPRSQRTPDERLNLSVGELVEVKPLEQILSTLNERGHNRGLSFDPEMVPYCGKQFRVAARVTQIIEESTGKMVHFDNPCIVLEGVVCQGIYSALRLMCPRQITPYWREIWLRRVEG